MDLQPSWDMPYGSSLGEDDKGRTPDPKGPVKTSCTVTRCAKRQKGREAQTTTTVLKWPIMKPAHHRCPCLHLHLHHLLHRPHNIFSSYSRQALSLIQKVGYSFYRHHIVSDKPLFSVDCC